MAVVAGAVPKAEPTPVRTASPARHRYDELVSRVEETENSTHISAGPALSTQRTPRTLGVDRWRSTASACGRVRADGQRSPRWCPHPSHAAALPAPSFVADRRPDACVSPYALLAALRASRRDRSANRLEVVGPIYDHDAVAARRRCVANLAIPWHGCRPLRSHP